MKELSETYTSFLQKNEKNIFEGISFFVRLSRCFWGSVYNGTDGDPKFESTGYRLGKIITLKRFKAELEANKLSVDLFVDSMSMLSSKKIIELCKDGKCFCVYPNGFFPVTFAQRLFSDSIDYNEVQYYVFKCIRQDNNCGHSSALLRAFNYITQSIQDLTENEAITFGLNDKIVLKVVELNSQEKYHIKLIDYCYNALLEKKLEAFSGDNYNDPLNVNMTSFKKRQREVVDTYFECARALRMIRVLKSNSHLRLSSAKLDPEYFISHLFGIPTDIKGLDELFGGLGPTLLEVRDNKNGIVDEYKEDTLGAKIIVISGPSGTGKSLLSHHIASSVARKGGISWIVPLEQTPKECVYNLQATGGIKPQDKYFIATDTKSINSAFTMCRNGQGALIITKPSDDDENRSEIKSFFNLIAHRAESLPQGLKLLIVDPLNSMWDETSDSKNITKMRKLLNELIVQCKNCLTNVIFVIEEDNNLPHENSSITNLKNLLLIKNLADIVLQLSVQSQNNYLRRYIQITKCRSQREQRGQHSFVINSGKGISVYPSTASVNARISKRHPLLPSEKIYYGLDVIDKNLLKDTLFHGDIIILQGSGGSCKTPLGLYFLKGKKVGLRHEMPPTTIIPLFFAARDDVESIRHIEKEMELPSAHIISLPRGNVEPGKILHIIQTEIECYRSKGLTVERVVIDNVDEFEMSSPNIADDTTFASTLNRLLRGLQVTSLLIVGSSNVSQSKFKNSLIENSDCVLFFEKFEFKGTNRTNVRITKSRGMRHGRGTFEIILEEHSIALRSSSSLLRINPADGRVKPVDIHLYLHSESDLQRKYNISLCDTMKSILSGNTQIDYQDLVYLNKAVSMGRYSAVDELQLIQIDEYQLEYCITRGEPGVGYPLLEIPIEAWNIQDSEDISTDIISCNSIKIMGEKKNIVSFLAVPLFANIDILAYDNEYFNGKNKILTSWNLLAKECQKYEESEGVNNLIKKMQENQDGGCLKDNSSKKLFFDFPRVSPENYNCLFFEILLSYLPINMFLKNIQKKGKEISCPLREWLCSEEAVTAGIIFRQLCRASYYLRNENDRIFTVPDKDDLEKPYKVSLNAKVWRHWYSTFSQMMLDFRIKGKCLNVSTCCMPKNVAISSEWYLGIPKSSAAPDIAMELIKIVTSREAELDRYRLGVGLPIRESFYRKDTNVNDEYSKTFQSEQDLIKYHKLLTKAFRRSDFACYVDVSTTLAEHLIKIIEITDEDEDNIKDAVQLILKMLVKRIDFLQGKPTDYTYAGCRVCKALNKVNK